MAQAGRRGRGARDVAVALSIALVGAVLVSVARPGIALANFPHPPPPKSANQARSSGSCDCPPCPGGDTSAGDPVNTATGEFWLAEPDVATAGIGVACAFVRRYNSNDTASTPLGRGWTHSYASQLIAQPNGDVLFRNGDGAEMLFVLQPDATFAGKPGVRSVLRPVPAGFEVLRPDQVHLAFDGAGRLLSQRDRNGQGVTMGYDGAGNLASITDSAGRVVALATTPDGRISRVTLPDGRHVDYSYTGDLLTQVRDLRGGLTAYGYDPTGRLGSVTDQNGHQKVRNLYDRKGRVIQQIDALGQASSFHYHSGDPFSSTTFTDANGHIWTYLYSHNVLVRTTDPLGDMSTLFYDDHLNVTLVRDAAGNPTTMTYDDRGNMLTRTVAAPGSTEAWAYDGLNDVVSYTDGRHHVWQNDFDGSGNLIKTTQPDATTITVDRDPAGTGLPVAVTDPRSKTTQFGYDTEHNLVLIVSPLGERTTFAYDQTGRRTSVVDPRGHAPGANPDEFRTRFVYDDADHTVRTIDPLGHISRMGYDPVGNVTSRVDANGHSTSYTYDDADRLTAVSGPDAGATAYGYDPAGNTASRVDANGHTTTWHYDDANRPNQTVTALGRFWAFTHDSRGNLATIVDPVGATTTYGYDGHDRVAAISYSDGAPSVAYSYDDNGNRATMTDGAGTVIYRYDDLNRLTAVARGADKFMYHYDAAGNVDRQTNPDQTASSYTYDSDERMATVTAADGTTSFSYDPAGNLVTTTPPAANGTAETRTYDSVGRMTAIAATKGPAVITSFAYTLDPVGNPLTETTPAGTRTYSYDSQNRLTQACYVASCAGPGGFIGYSYDHVGNRTKQTRPDGTTRYAYDPDDELTTITSPAGTTHPSYDNDGRQTSDATHTVTWDARNRPLTVTDPTGTTSYSYDGDGLRLTASAGAADTTQFAWDVNHRLPLLAGETDASGNAVRSYRYGPEITPVSMRTAGTADSYFEHDHLGTTAAVTSATGDTERRYTYEPFGTITSATATAGAPANPIGYTGQYHDPTDLYHLRARQYDTTLGRFLSRDPLAAPMTDSSVSRYAYVGNRITVMTDASGMMSKAGWGLAIGAGLFLAVVAVIAVPEIIATLAVASAFEEVGLGSVLAADVGAAWATAGGSATLADWMTIGYGVGYFWDELCK